jgi:endonuclease G
MQRKDKVQEGMLPVLNVPYLPYSYPIDVASIPDDSWLDAHAAVPLSEIQVVPETDSLAVFRSTVRVGDSRLAIQHAPWGTPLSRSDQVLIYRSAYVLNFSPETKTPRWVSYVLRATTDRDSRPPNRFLPDPALAAFVGSQASGEDYWQSGYDRGHLISLSDMMFRGSEGIRLASYFSTVAPQAPWTNRRLWAKLEKYGRQVAASGPVYILAGPVFTPVSRTGGIHGPSGFVAIGPNHIWVPSHFFRIIARRKPDGTPDVLAFLVPNATVGDGDTIDLATFLTSVAEIQRLTKLTFFPRLPLVLRLEVVNSRATGLW